VQSKNEAAGTHHIRGSLPVLCRWHRLAALWLLLRPCCAICRSLLSSYDLEAFLPPMGSRISLVTYDEHVTGQS
jgi:hypothetical protein